MLRPKISVIITTYNIESYINECLESVLSQSMAEIEVICIDDASTDHSLDILNQYAARDSRVRVFPQSESIGPSTARNIGYREAKGEYVYQIDGDDFLVDGALDRMYRCAEENQLDFLTFSADAFADTKEIEDTVKDSLNLYKRIGTYDGVMKGMELFAECMRNGDFLGNLCCILLNKDFFDKYNMYLLDGLYASADNNFLFYLNAQRVMCIKDELYMRRFRDNSIVSSKKTLLKFESILVEYVYEFSLWNQYHFEDFIEDALEKYFAKFWMYALKTYNQVTEKTVPLKLLPKHKLAKFVYDYYINETSVYWTKQTGEMIERIRQYEKVIIYGAKDIGQDVRRVLEKNRITNYLFAVSDNQNEANIDGTKIYNIEELEYLKKNAIVIIAVSKRHHEGIRKKLLETGFEHVLAIE